MQSALAAAAAAPPAATPAARAASSCADFLAQRSFGPPARAATAAGEAEAAEVAEAAEAAAGPVYRSAAVSIAGAQPRPFDSFDAAPPVYRSIGDLSVALPTSAPPLRLPSSVGSDGDGRSYASPPSGGDIGRGSSAGPSPVTLAIDGISQTLTIGGSRQATRISGGALPLAPVGPRRRELGEALGAD